MSSGKVLPVTAYDKDGVRMLLNFASDCPPGRPDVLVMVVSMLNTAPLPVHNVVLQAAVPKVKTLTHLFFHCGHHLVFAFDWLLHCDLSPTHFLSDDWKSLSLDLLKCFVLSSNHRIHT